MQTTTFEAAHERFKTTKAYALSSPEPPSSLADIEEFERTHGYRLPSEYKQVAAKLGTGEIGFAPVFSVGPGPYNIAAQRDAVPEMPPDFVPVSDNGCGDFYGFLVHAGHCRSEIYFADHGSQYKPARTEFADLYEYLVRYAFNAA